MMACKINGTTFCCVNRGHVRQTFYRALPTTNNSASYSIAFFWTISIHQLMIVIFILYDVKTALKFRWTNIGFLPPLSDHTNIVRSHISQIGIWGRGIFCIWYGSISKSSLRDRILIRKGLPKFVRAFVLRSGSEYNQIQRQYHALSWENPVVISYNSFCYKFIVCWCEI